MVKFLQIFPLLLLPILTFAQAPSSCGTPTIKSSWLKQYQQRSATSLKGLDKDSSLLYIPMTVHNVGTDEGENHTDILKVLDAFCTLNEDFAAANIQFYLKDGIQYINNAAFNEHDSVKTGGLFMKEYDVPNTVNTYIVKDAAGNGGYNLPWASSAVNKAFINRKDHVWAHELGHQFTLPHPFFGWEGGVSYDDSIPFDYQESAPEYVLANYTIFKDTLWGDTLIIDTVLVEKVDGSNCHIAADGFCDTSPDYLSVRWDCTREGVSETPQTDPNGVVFRSDASLIMSYAADDCASQFTPEQIAAMRSYLQEEQSDLIEEVINEAPIVDLPQLNYPIAREAVPANAIDLSWEPVPNATHYVVQVGITSSFPGSPGNFETTETSIRLPELPDNRRYYWRVRPYNLAYTCTDDSITESFEVTGVTAIETIDGLEDLLIYPTVMAKGSPIKMELQTSQLLTAQVHVVDLTGRVLYTKDIKNSLGKQRLSIDTNTLSAGVYFVGINNGVGQTFERVVLY